MVESSQSLRSRSSRGRPRVFLMTNRSDGTPAAVLEIHSPLLDLGFVPTRPARAALERSSESVGPRVEPAVDRAQTLLMLGAGALAVLLLWAPILLELPVARGLVGYVLAGVLFAMFAVFYGLLRFISAAPRPELDRWKLRILAALGSVVHAVIYMQALQ